MVQFKPEKYGIGLDTYVWPVVEISEDGTHPIPWPNVPKPGPTNDWHILNRMALRFEWQANDGVWYIALFKVLTTFGLVF